MPVNQGRREGDLVIIDECVVCGDTHRHGAVDFASGESTRAGHCSGSAPEYRIVLEGGADHGE